MTQLPPQAGGWSRVERSLAYAVLDGRTVVVNVRKSGPHKHLVPWLHESGLLTYVGHAGPRHDWPESDFANPFLRMAGSNRAGMVRRYREWLAEQPRLLARLHAGELTGRAVGCWCAPDACHADVIAGWGWALPSAARRAEGGGDSTVANRVQRRSG